jgi:hypothetical protein
MTLSSYQRPKFIAMLNATLSQLLEKRKSTMSEDVKVSITLTLPRGHYQVATALTQIYDYANLDEYVSDTIKENVEMLLNGIEPLRDSIYRRLTGKPSPYMQEVKEQFGPINKRLKQMVKEQNREEVAS